MALITAAEAREAFQALDSSQDTLLGELIGAVGAAFARRCGWPPATVGGVPSMESAARTLYLDGPGGRDLDLGLYPVTAITSVYDDPTGDYTDAAYLVPSADYTLVDGRTLRLLSTASWGGWGRGRRRIRVICTAGYTTVPDDLQQLARQAVRYAYDLRHRAGLASLQGPAGSTSYRTEDLIPPHVDASLGTYLLPRVAL